MSGEKFLIQKFYSISHFFLFLQRNNDNNGGTC